MFYIYKIFVFFAVTKTGKIVVKLPRDNFRSYFPKLFSKDLWLKKVNLIVHPRVWLIRLCTDVTKLDVEHVHKQCNNFLNKVKIEN